MALPTPPRESIAPRKKHNFTELQSGIELYRSIEALEEFKTSTDYGELLEADKALFDDAYNSRLDAYEKNQLLVDSFV